MYVHVCYSLLDINTLTEALTPCSSVHAVLPDTELWPNEYVQVVFGSDPTAEVAHLRSKSADARRAAAGVHAKH